MADTQMSLNLKQEEERNLLPNPIDNINSQKPKMKLSPK